MGSGFFMDFSATKKIKIRDPVLGISNRLIQLACLIYAIVDFVNGGMLYFETPRGHAQFWANQADLQVEQTLSPAYCTGPGRNYGDRFCQQERDAGFGIFCEFDVACRAFAFSEMNIKVRVPPPSPRATPPHPTPPRTPHDRERIRCSS